MRVLTATVVLLTGVTLMAMPAGALPRMGANDQAQAVVSTTAQRSAATEVQTAFDKAGVAGARETMREIESHRDRYVVSEEELNALGYRYLGRQAFPEALATFEFIVRLFPASDNAYDSLAEAAVTAGDNARLEATLGAWTAKRPGDASVERRATAFRALMARVVDERGHSYAPGQPAGVQGPYLGQTPPGTTPTLFAPGIVSLAMSPEGAGCMSPDGKAFYFGAGGRNPGAVVARPSGLARFGGANAVMVSRLGPQGWTFPEPLAVTAGYAAREPHISPATGRLFWEWLRAVPPGEADPQNLGTGIWWSERTTSGWAEPRFAGQVMAPTSNRAGEFFVTDISELTKGKAFIARVQVNDGKFTALERLQSGPERLRSDKMTNLAHPVIATDGSYLIFDTGGPPARICFRQQDGSWGEPIDLSAHGLGPNATVTSVSPDGKYLFLNMGGDIYWVSTALVEALRPKR